MRLQIAWTKPASASDNRARADGDRAGRRHEAAPRSAGCPAAPAALTLTRTRERPPVLFRRGRTGTESLSHACGLRVRPGPVSGAPRAGAPASPGAGARAPGADRPDCCLPVLPGSGPVARR